MIAAMPEGRREALNVAWRHRLALFPLSSGSKVPPKGFGWKDRSVADLDQWRAWFTDPAVNIGADCGKSGIVVVDVDPRHDGFESVATLISLGYPLPATLTQTTRADGVHYLFRAPSWALSNTAGRLPGIEEPLPGVDLRGAGGYIVYASSTMGGSSWELQNPEAAIAECPTWLRPAPETRTRSVLTDNETATLRGSYLAAAVRDEARRVVDAATGTRNDTLVRAAFNLGQLTGSGLTEQMVTDVLTEAALGAGLTRREAAPTIRSGLRSGAASPRKVGAR